MASSVPLSSIMVSCFSMSSDCRLTLAFSKTVFENAKVKRQSLLIEKQLTIMELRGTLEAIAATIGSGSREKKERLIQTLYSQATPSEAKALTKIFTAEMRTGLNEGLMEQAIAKAFEIPLAAVQRASMTLGDIGEVASLAKTKG